TESDVLSETVGRKRQPEWERCPHAVERVRQQLLNEITDNQAPNTGAAEGGDQCRHATGHTAQQLGQGFIAKRHPTLEKKARWRSDPLQNETCREHPHEIDQTSLVEIHGN